MKTLKKTLTTVSLLCYLAVSSLAVVHASSGFKFQPDSTQHQSAAGMQADTMMPNCHQQASPLSDQASSSLCNIFCSALGNVISNEFDLFLSPLALDAEVAFLQKGLPTRPVKVEPHPPKQIT